MPLRGALSQKNKRLIYEIISAMSTLTSIEKAISIAILSRKQLFNKVILSIIKDLRKTKALSDDGSREIVIITAVEINRKTSN